ncbi:Metallo-hydrolase/oxidoreductase [Jaminaea rosea]|uniref:Metallo-hydrolase/oxidoreductase n=1 Tax=Jaminaea rosea TaxID=1569628 RepID=A0A316UL94_9BASI|nr:Metallo-hydrolase/oxidoreductase [Jaminaea rosea]PWN26037.1 Metallo-hydrolase/oxidoreductase [Jaminaea rosea]
MTTASAASSSRHDPRLTFQSPAQPLTPPAFYRPTGPNARPPHWQRLEPRGFKSPWPSSNPRITGLWSFLRTRYYDARDEWQEPPLPKKGEGMPVVREAKWLEDGGREEDERVRLTWLGHASCHLQLPLHDSAKTTLNILTDPVLSHRCSPVQFMGPARYTEPCTSVEAMAQDDRAWPHVVVLSHNHYDHMDYGTIKALLSRPNGREQPLWLVPLGLKKWFEQHCKELPSEKVVELDWWEETIVAAGEGRAGVKFTCTPAQHFSGRSINDRNQTLWASWAMHVLPSDTSASRHPSARIWFSGDSGYRSLPRGFPTDGSGDESSLPHCPAFREIGQLLGPFDLALIACGAYQPRSMFSELHMNPRESVQVHKEIGARRSVGIHHSTFRLTSEEVNEPANWFVEEGRKAGLGEGEVGCLGIGETSVVKVHGQEEMEGQKAAL